MYILLQLLPELTLLAAVAGILQLVVLAFRNPFRPAWLRRDWAAIAAALAVTVLISATLGIAISGASAAGFDLGRAISLTLAAGIGTGYAIWRAFHIRERLRRADGGQSPFHAPGTADLQIDRSLRLAYRRRQPGG